MNARHLLILPLILLTSGCAFVGGLFGSTKEVKPIQVQTKAVEKTKLSLPDPAPIQTREIKWVIITPENADAVWKQLREDKTDLVLIGLTDTGYEQLALTMAEIRSYIVKQKLVLVKYREYYEPKEEPKEQQKKNKE